MSPNALARFECHLLPLSMVKETIQKQTLFCCLTNQQGNHHDTRPRSWYFCQTQTVSSLHVLSCNIRAQAAPATLGTSQSGREISLCHINLSQTSVWGKSP